MDRFLADHLRGVSRTYAIIIPMLPRTLGEPVGVAYLLMRIVDTIEDATTLTDAQRHALFDMLGRVLRDEDAAVPAELSAPLGDTPAEVALASDTGVVIDRLRALDPVYRAAAQDCALEMIAGVRMLMARATDRGWPYPAVATAEELREYCYYVAGVVGIMLNRMMSHYLRLPGMDRLHDLAVELGVGLQLVNILKDAFVDAERGRRYLPTAAEGAISHREVYRAALAEARNSLSRGVEFVLALPPTARELRYFCGLPIAWGAMTLARAERQEGDAKIGRHVIQSSIDRFKALAGDDSALQRWLRSMIRGQQVPMNH